MRRKAARMGAAPGRGKAVTFRSAEAIPLIIYAVSGDAPWSLKPGIVCDLNETRSSRRH